MFNRLLGAAGEGTFEPATPMELLSGELCRAEIVVVDVVLVAGSERLSDEAVVDESELCCCCFAASCSKNAGMSTNSMDCVVP